MASKTSQECRMCNRGLQLYNIPSGSSSRMETYTYVKSPRAVQHVKKKYRYPPAPG